MGRASRREGLPGEKGSEQKASRRGEFSREDRAILDNKKAKSIHDYVQFSSLRMKCTLVSPKTSSFNASSHSFA